MTTASEKAHALLDGVRKLDDEWARAIGSLGEPELRAPSALPGLVAGARPRRTSPATPTGCKNLLTWANTGVETPMYASAEASEADIEAGVAARGRRASSPTSSRPRRGSSSTPPGCRRRLGARSAQPPGRARHRNGRRADAAVRADHPPRRPRPRLRPRSRAGPARPARRGRRPARGHHPGARTCPRSAWSPRAPGSGRWVPRRAPPSPARSGQLLAWLSGRSDGGALDGDVPRLPAWS